MTIFTPIEEVDPRLFIRHPGTLVVFKRTDGTSAAAKIEGTRTQEALDRAHKTFGKPGAVMPTWRNRGR